MIATDPDSCLLPRGTTLLDDELRQASSERQAVAPDRLVAFGPKVDAKNILVAEDNDSMRALIARALRQQGHRVVEVRNGFELMHWVELMRRWTPVTPIIDLVVTDYRMPMFTGIECIGQLHLARVGTPVIMITAFGDRQLHKEALRQGASQVLDKPLDMPVLCAEVDRLLAS